MYGRVSDVHFWSEARKLLMMCTYYRCGEVCSHVAAVLFKIEACIRLKIASRSCTELPCVWNQAFSKKVSGFGVPWKINKHGYA